MKSVGSATAVGPNDADLLAPNEVVEPLPSSQRRAQRSKPSQGRNQPVRIVALTHAKMRFAPLNGPVAGDTIGPAATP